MSELEIDEYLKQLPFVSKFSKSFHGVLIHNCGNYITEIFDDTLHTVPHLTVMDCRIITLDNNYAQIRIQRFMKKVSDKLGYNFTDDVEWKEISKIICHNFVCSDIFKWNIEEWRKYRPDERNNIEEKKKREKLEQTAKVETDWDDFK